MEAEGFTETFVIFSQTTQCHTSEDGNLQISRLEHFVFLCTVRELRVFNARDYSSLADYRSKCRNRN
jgi:hypothetical protein